MSAIAKLHVAKKQLGLDDDTYRDALQLVTGKRSAKDLTEKEQVAVLKHFEGNGFKPRPSTRADGRKLLTGKYAGKLQALWIAGWNLGLVRNKDDAALLAFVKRQTGIDHTRFLRDADDARKAIEAMKKWLAREGVDWTVGVHMANYARLSGYKIARAQFTKIIGSEKRMGAFWEAVAEIAGASPPSLLKEADWHPVMNAFGKRIRAAAVAKEKAA